MELCSACWLPLLTAVWRWLGRGALALGCEWGGWQRANHLDMTRPLTKASCTICDIMCMRILATLHKLTLDGTSMKHYVLLPKPARYHAVRAGAYI